MNHSQRIAAAPERDYGAHFPTRLTLLVTSMLTVAAAAVIAPALPEIRAVFADEPNAAFWIPLVVTLPTLFIVLTAPIAGYIVDRWGRKRVLAGSVLLYGVVGASGALAQSLGALLIGRALLGVTVAGVMTGVTALIADYYSGGARARMLGFQSSFMGLGGTVFITLSGFLSASGWHMPFLIYGLALLIFPFVLVVLHEPPRPAAVPQAAAHSTDKLPLGVMGLVYAAVGIAQIVNYTMVVQTPFYVLLLDPDAAPLSGALIGWMAFVYAMMAIVSPRLGAPPLALLVGGFGLMSVGALLLSTAGSVAVLALFLPIVGAGIALIMPTMNGLLVSKLPPALRGRGVGGYTTALFMGQFLSTFISQPLADALGLPGMFVAFALGTAALVLLLVLLRRTIRVVTA